MIPREIDDQEGAWASDSSDIEVQLSFLGLPYGGKLNDSLVVLFILVSGRIGRFYVFATEIDDPANGLDNVLVIWWYIAAVL